MTNVGERLNCLVKKGSLWYAGSVGGVDGG